MYRSVTSLYPMVSSLCIMTSYQPNNCLMSASSQSSTRSIDLVTQYEFDGEPECQIQRLNVLFLSDDTAVVASSLGILEDFRLMFGDRIILSPLPDGKYELVGVQHPSPMRHFESAGGGNAAFPTEALNRLGGEWESELMLWVTHIPTAEFDAFCTETGLVFPPSTEIFSGLSSLPFP